MTKPKRPYEVIEKGVKQPPNPPPPPQGRATPPPPPNTQSIVTQPLPGELFAYKPAPGDVLFFQTTRDVTQENLVAVRAAIQENLPEGIEVIVLAGISVLKVHRHRCEACEAYDETDDRVDLARESIAAHREKA